MGRKAKVKTTTKATRTPVPFWPAWLDLLADLEGHKPAELLVEPKFSSSSLRLGLDLAASLDSLLPQLKLLVSVHKNWQAQNASLVAITELFKPIAKASPDAVSTLLALPLASKKLTLVANILAEAFFASQDVIFRRALLVHLTKINDIFAPQLSSILLYKLYIFIESPRNVKPLLNLQHLILSSDHDSWEAQAYHCQYPSTKAIAILTLLQMPISSPLLSKLDLHILNYLLDSLDSTIARMTAPSSNSSLLVTPIDVIEGFNLIHHLGKVVLFISSKSENYANLRAVKTNPTLVSLNTETITVQLQRIFTLFNKVLFFEKSDFGIDAREISALIVISCLKCLSTSAPSNQIAEFLSQVSQLQNSALRASDPATSVCVSRAIISKLEDPTTIYNPSHSSFCVSILQSSYNQIANMCEKSYISPSLKVVSFDSLNMWLQKISKLTSSFPSFPGLDISTVRVFNATMCKFILGNNQDHLMSLLWTYWDDPIEAVQHKVKAIFEALLDIAITFSTDQNIPPNLSTDFINFVVNQVVAMDWSQKVKYSLLASLIKRLGANVILSKQQDLIYTALTKMENLMMAPRVAQLISSLLSDFKNKNYSSDGNKVDIDYFETWAVPISRVLLTGNDNLVKMVSRHILPISFQTNDEIFWHIVNLIVQSSVNSSDLQSLPQSQPRAQSQKTDLLANKSLASNTEIYNDNYKTVFTFTQYSKEPEISGSDNHISAIVSVLFTAKSLGLIEPTTTANGTLSYTLKKVTSQLDTDSSITDSISGFLIKAINHQNWTVRADALGLLCMSCRLLDPIHHSEADLVKQLLEKSANSPNPEFRQRQYSTLIAWAERLLFALFGASRKIEKATEYQEKNLASFLETAPLSSLEQSQKLNQDVIELQKTADLVKSIIKWWYELAIECLYPGATFVRVATGIQWLSLIVKYFSSSNNKNIDLISKNQLPECSPATLKNVLDLTQLNSVYPVISVLINDTFKINRNAAFDLLLKWPASGTKTNVADLASTGSDSISISTPIKPKGANPAACWINELVSIGIKKTFQTRSNESESGAHLLYFVFCKFVLQDNTIVLIEDLSGICDYNNHAISALSHYFDVSNNYINFLPPSITTLVFVSQLVYSLQNCLLLMQSNLLDAALKRPASGLLMTIKLIIEKIDFSSLDHDITDKHASCSVSEIWKTMVGDLNLTLDSMSDVIISVLSNPSPEGNIPASFKDTDLAISSIPDNIGTTSPPNATIYNGNDGDGDRDFGCDEFADEFDSSLKLEDSNSKASPKHQIILSFCWRTIKEISGLQAQIICCLPATDTCTLVSQSAGEKPRETTTATTTYKTLLNTPPIISTDLVINVGERLFTLLTSIRHRGAFAAVYVEFSKACKRIYNSADPNVNKHIATWLSKCLTFILSHQVSITRRSAGWPYCLLALITSDPNCIINNLPPTAKRLFDIANQDVMIDKNENNNVDLPQVHAINMIRILIDDKILHSDMVPYTENAMLLAVNGLESSFWPIRNVCGLLFATLMRKLFGIKKSKTESAKVNGITARELFTKFPGLFSLLFNKIQASASQLDQFYLKERQSAFKIGFLLNGTLEFVNPALYPCLTLISRLQMPTGSQPGPEKYCSSLENTISRSIDQEHSNITGSNSAAFTSSNSNSNSNSNNNTDSKPVSNNLSLLSFTQLVIRCSKSPVMKTRLMAAKAVVPTIPIESVSHFLIKLAQKVCDNLTLLVRQETHFETINANENTSVISNEIHGYLAIIYELLLAHTGSSVAVTEYTIINTVSPVILRLKPLVALAMDDRIQNEIIRSTVIKILLLLVGNIEWFERHSYFIWRSDLASADLVAESQNNSLPNRKLEIEQALGCLNEFQQVIWQDYCTKLVTKQALAASKPSSLSSLPDNRLILGAPDTAVELVKLVLKLSAFYSTFPKLWTTIKELPSIKSTLSLLLEMTDFYEIHIFLMDWLNYFIPQLISDPLTQTTKKAEMLEILVNKLVDLVFNGQNNSPSLHSDPIVAIKALSTLSMAFTLCYKSHLYVFSSLNASKLSSIWRFGIQFIKTAKLRISVKCSLLDFLSSLLIPIKDLIDSQTKIDTSYHHSIQDLVDIISEWSDEDSTILYRQASCNAIENLCLYSTIESDSQIKSLGMEFVSAKLVMALFTLLFDDDVDIRNQSANTVSRLLAKINQSEEAKNYSNDHAAELLLSTFLKAIPSPYLQNITGLDIDPEVSLNLAHLLVQQMSIDNLSTSSLSYNSGSNTLFEKEPNNVYKEQIYILELIYSLLENFIAECTVFTESLPSLLKLQKLDNSNVDVSPELWEYISKIKELCSILLSQAVVSSNHLIRNPHIMNGLANKQEIDLAMNLLLITKLGLAASKLDSGLDLATLGLSSSAKHSPTLANNLVDIDILLSENRQLSNTSVSKSCIHSKLALVIKSL